MRGEHSALMCYPEFIERLRRVAHRLPVRLRSHDYSNVRRRHSSAPLESRSARVMYLQDGSQAKHLECGGATPFWLSAVKRSHWSITSNGLRHTTAYSGWPGRFLTL